MSKYQSYSELEMQVVRWAEARSIVRNGKHIGQARKTLEESGELLEAISRVNALNDVAHLYNDVAIRPEFKLLMEDAQSAVRDAVGDIIVTLIVGCAVADINVVSCLGQAYDEIKDRKGTLRADGVFVKEK